MKVVIIEGKRWQYLEPGHIELLMEYCDTTGKLPYDVLREFIKTLATKVEQTPAEAGNGHLAAIARDEHNNVIATFKVSPELAEQIGSKVTIKDSSMGYELDNLDVEYQQPHYAPSQRLRALANRLLNEYNELVLVAEMLEENDND